MFLYGKCIKHTPFLVGGYPLVNQLNLYSFFSSRWSLLSGVMSSLPTTSFLRQQHQQEQPWREWGHHKTGILVCFFLHEKKTSAQLCCKIPMVLWDTYNQMGTLANHGRLLGTSDNLIEQLYRNILLHCAAVAGGYENKPCIVYVSANWSSCEICTSVKASNVVVNAKQAHFIHRVKALHRQY